jgi:hypothetical protein
MKSCRQTKENCRNCTGEISRAPSQPRLMAIGDGRVRIAFGRGADPCDPALLHQSALVLFGLPYLEGEIDERDDDSDRTDRVSDTLKLFQIDARHLGLRASFESSQYQDGIYSGIIPSFASMRGR